MAQNEDDAWLEQLREALASTADEDQSDRREPFTFSGPAQTPPAQSPPEPSTIEAPRHIELRSPPRNPDPPPAGAEPGSGLAGVRDALRALSGRMTAVESLTEDIARQSRRAGSGPDAALIEEIVSRVVRAELPVILKEHLSTLPPVSPMGMGQEAVDRWVAQVEHGEISAGEVVMLADELRARITQLEDIQRHALEELAADRRQLIEGAVAEIRSMLFGQ